VEQVWIGVFLEMCMFLGCHLCDYVISL
jgi:hypothetical protein